MPRSFVILLGAMLLALTATPAAAEWRRVDTPNFVVVGDVGEGTLKDIAVRFEAFRETLGRVLSSRVTTTPRRPAPRPPPGRPPPASRRPSSRQTCRMPFLAG